MEDSEQPEENIQSKKLQGENFWHTMIAVYDAVAESMGKSGWVCKDNALFDFAPEIIDSFPDAKFVYLVRDGRDVALSFITAPSGPCSITDALRLWLREQEQSLRVMSLYPDNVVQIRYESLLVEPQGQLESVCSHIDISFSQRMVTEYGSNDGLSTRSDFWKNTDKPLIVNNRLKWLTKMSALRNCYCQALFDRRVKAMLKLNNYDVMTCQERPFMYRLLRSSDMLLKIVRSLWRRVYRSEQELRAAKASKINEIIRSLTNPSV